MSERTKFFWLLLRKKHNPPLQNIMYLARWGRGLWLGQFQICPYPPPPHPSWAFYFFQNAWSNFPPTSDSSKVFPFVKPFKYPPKRNQNIWSLRKLSYRGFFISRKLFILESQHWMGFSKGSQMLQQNSEYRSNDPWMWCTCWMVLYSEERITKSFCLRRPALTQTWNARLGWPHFGSNSPTYVTKFQSNARGMPGWGGDGRFGNCT